jgi:hypothetical protein
MSSVRLSSHARANYPFPPVETNQWNPYNPHNYLHDLFWVKCTHINVISGINNKFMYWQFRFCLSINKNVRIIRFQWMNQTTKRKAPSGRAVLTRPTRNAALMLTYSPLSINKNESYVFNEWTNGETKSFIRTDSILIIYQFAHHLM